MTGVPCVNDHFTFIWPPTSPADALNICIKIDAKPPPVPICLHHLAMSCLTELGFIGLYQNFIGLLGRQKTSPHRPHVHRTAALRKTCIGPYGWCWVGIGCNFSLGSLNVKFVELWLYEDLKVYHCILRCWLPTSPICTCTWSFWACFIFFRICIYTLYNYIDEERNITTRHLVVSRVQTQDPFRLLLLQAVSFLGMLYTWCCPSLLEGK